MTKVGPELGSFDDAPDELRKRVQTIVEGEWPGARSGSPTDERSASSRQSSTTCSATGRSIRSCATTTITEIMVNGHDQVFIERAGLVSETDVRFAERGPSHARDRPHRRRVGRRIDEASPMVDARLPDGSRVNVIIPPIALQGPVLTIRKFSADAFTADNLIDLGTLTPELVDVLSGCVRGKLNVLISGGTGVGKTTLLNILSSFIPDNERIITIEDAAELQLQQRARASRSRRGRRTSRARARSGSASSCGTRCACGPTGSSSARSAARRRSTCSRR